MSGFYRLAEQLVYDVAALVRTADGSRGYLVERRRLTSGQQANRLIAELIGSEAAIMVGSPGGVWTDLTGAVAIPPTGDTMGTREYVRAGVRRFQEAS